MELSARKYYDHNRYANSQYAVFMAIEQYFAREIFKNDGSRMIYAPIDYAFRQRINKLIPSISPPYTSLHASQLQFPFGIYYRDRNFQLDDRVAIQNATAALFGFPMSDTDFTNVRFLQVMENLSLTFFFDRDDDAQLAYDTLLWIKHPAPKQFPTAGLSYKNMEFDLPIVLWIDDVKWTNEYKEKDWLEKNRIITITVDLHIRTVLVDQYAQGDNSTIFDPYPIAPEDEIVLTREAILDFLSYKKDPLIDVENIEIDIIGSFTPDPDLMATFSVQNITETSFELLWDYNPLADTYYEPEVMILLDNGTRIRATRSDKSFVVTDLIANSTYIVAIYFVSTKGHIIKLTQTISTTPSVNPPDLKGLIGYTF